MDWHAQGRTARTAEVHIPGPQPGDAGIGADGQDLIYEADGWHPVPEPEAGG